MTRVRDWPLHLDEVIERYQADVFAWGARDCFTLPMDASAALIGVDRWAVERTYSTKIGAARKLKRLGFADVADAFAAKFEEIPPALAQRGDIGSVADANGAACGVVVLGTLVAGMSPVAGLTFLPRARLVRAFRVA
ncbi:hypothetical protein J5J86_13935 [Aquabacter sp. L1I39]|uniref:DUF6950 family protein n=1 Tax=Aquabacter sp. L1I39 TaxID=2820278 RepID=UPI001ADBA0B3|nr:hypothetical protein [Aquabacter sp. L1I39]QTL01906.1 hypothetical protein J5J86_13935 [Aquabacter sp. L1I39]